ncbi:MAG: sensor histidine kinase [Pirellulaceae bacterium]
MSIDPQQLWSERFREIGSLIEIHAEALVERWSARALVEQPAADDVARSELRDSLPDWVRALGRALAQPVSEEANGHRWVAFEHGQQRWQVGWKLDEVVRDYQILRLVILEFLESMLPYPLQVRECMAVGLGIDEAIGASIEAYVRNRDESVRDTLRRTNEFLSVLSHELRNFLAPLTSALDVLELEQPSLTSNQLHGVMRRSTDSLTRLVGELLDISRASSGKLTVARQPVNLQEVVSRALETMHNAVQERNQHIVVSMPPDTVWVRGETFRLTQVLVNLLHNASKYSPWGKALYLQLEGEGQEAVLRVRDEGVGIAPDLLPEVFKMFFQAEGGPSRSLGGLGIGLALVSKLVELHGGNVRASSAGVGQGSEFTVRLPLLQPEEADLTRVLNDGRLPE